jgi:DeoR family transcriptional regulator of aga operon
VDTIIRKGDHSTPELVPNRKKLQVLAQKAAKLIHPHTTIFLDSGEKTVEMARVMPDIPVEIYTVSLTCAIELARLKEARIFMTGGELNTGTLDLFGPHTSGILGGINFDAAFLDTSAWDEKAGFTCDSNEGNWLKQNILSQSVRNIMLIESSEVGKRKPYTICRISDIQEIVSDGQLPDSFVLQCQRAGVAVY